MRMLKNFAIYVRYSTNYKQKKRKNEKHKNTHEPVWL